MRGTKLQIHVLWHDLRSKLQVLIAFLDYDCYLITVYPSLLLTVQDSDLPEGWESRMTKDGRRFYVDHNTRTTTWDHPKLASRKADKVDELGPLPVRDDWISLSLSLSLYLSISTNIFMDGHN